MIILWLLLQAHFLFRSLTFPDSALIPVTTRFLSVLPKALTSALPKRSQPGRHILSAQRPANSTRRSSAPVRWPSWLQLHVLKSYSRLSSWCLGLNRLALKSATYVSRKSPDLPVSEVKLPFFFLLSRKPQSLVTTFSFPSSLKLSPPPILKSG